MVVRTVWVVATCLSWLIAMPTTGQSRFETTLPEAKAVPLLTTQENGTITLNEAALVNFDNLTNLYVIAITGRARSGKSYLASRLLHRPDAAFKVGHSRESQTRGIWAWSGPVSYDNNGIQYVILDTEGTQAFDTAMNVEGRLAAIITTISHHVLLNSKELPDYSAFDRLATYTASTLAEVLDIQLESGVNITTAAQRPLLTLTIQDVDKAAQPPLNLTRFIEAEASVEVQHQYSVLQRTFANITAIELEDPVDNRKLYSQLPGLKRDALKTSYLEDVATLTSALATTAVEHNLPRWSGSTFAALLRNSVARFNNVTFTPSTRTTASTGAFRQRAAMASVVAVKSYQKQSQAMMADCDLDFVSSLSVLERASVKLLEGQLFEETLARVQPVVQALETTLEQLRPNNLRIRATTMKVRAEAELKQAAHQYAADMSTMELPLQPAATLALALNKTRDHAVQQFTTRTLATCLRAAPDTHGAYKQALQQDIAQANLRVMARNQAQLQEFLTEQVAKALQALDMCLNKAKIPGSTLALTKLIAQCKDSTEASFASAAAVAVNEPIYSDAAAKLSAGMSTASAKVLAKNEAAVTLVVQGAEKDILSSMQASIDLPLTLPAELDVLIQTLKSEHEQRIRASPLAQYLSEPAGQQSYQLLSDKFDSFAQTLVRSNQGLLEAQVYKPLAKLLQRSSNSSFALQDVFRIAWIRHQLMPSLERELAHISNSSLRRSFARHFLDTHPVAQAHFDSARQDLITVAVAVMATVLLVGTLVFCVCCQAPTVDDSHDDKDDKSPPLSPMSNQDDDSSSEVDE